MASLRKTCRHADRDACGCTWYIRARQAGRDTYTPIGSDRAKAEKALARLSRRRDETVSEAVDVWLAAKEREPGARAGSLAAYRGRAHHIRAFFGTMPVRAVRAEHLTGFAAALLEEGYSPATVGGIYAALTATLRHAVRRGAITTLPVPPDGPGIPTPRPRTPALTPAQVEAIIADMPGVWGQVAELILLTGLRWGEAVAIEEGDIDGGVLHVRRTRTRDGTVNPPKTSAGARAVPLSARARAILKRLDLPVGGEYRQARLALVVAMGPLHQPGMGWHTPCARPTLRFLKRRGCPCAIRPPGWVTDATGR